MTSFYENLKKATNNTEEITTEKYATITKINNNQTADATETENEITHQNCQIINHNFKTGDKVILGFINNNPYEPIIYGGLKNPTNYEKQYETTNITIYSNNYENYLILKGEYETQTTWTTLTTIPTTLAPHTETYFTINHETTAKILTNGEIQTKSQTQQTITNTTNTTYPQKEKINAN